MKFLRFILAFILSWFIPGLGYLVLNKKAKFLLLFLSIMALTFAGAVLADFREIRFIDNPYYYIGRFGSGLIWGIIIILLKQAPTGIVPLQYFDVGHLYLCVAGTLNLIIALSVFTQKIKMPKPQPVETAFTEPVITPAPPTQETNTLEAN